MPDKLKVVYIKERLSSDDRWLIRGLIAIYNYQTSDEKSSGETKELNGMGFNGADAFILSKFAQQYLEKKWLSEKQLEIARKKMSKYARQLVEIARIKGGENA